MSNKKLLKDILLSIPTGLLFVYFVNKLNELIITEEDEFNDKVKKTIVFSIIASICGYILAIYVFSEKHKLANRMVKYALTLGSTIIAINTFANNWELLEKDTKTFMIGGFLLTIILVSYKL
jgi:hypothetical protein